MNADPDNPSFVPTSGRDYQALLVAGARPNFMKVAPLFHWLRENGGRIRPKLVHTGQHYDPAMSEVFLRDLGLPDPDFVLRCGDASAVRQTADVMVGLDELLERNRPDLVVVVGDVNSTLAAALVAAKRQVPLVHVEAGLRSRDRSMPEELNRIATDHLSDLLLVSEPSGVDNLRSEGLAGAKVEMVGNLMIDTLSRHLKAIRGRRVAERLGLAAAEYDVVTLHRPATVDREEGWARVLDVVAEVSRERTVVWPLHPRTRRNMEAFGFDGAFRALPGLRLIEPMGYMDFIGLVDEATMVMTDSGGIQEETTWLGVPCLTLRENTERPLTTEAGTNRLVGLDRPAVLAARERVRDFVRDDYRPPALWDGRAAPRAVAAIVRLLERTMC